MESFFHTYNRGTEKRNIFVNDIDYIRAVHDLYEFNDEQNTINLGYHFGRAPDAPNESIYWSSTPIDGGSVSKSRDLAKTPNAGKDRKDRQDRQLRKILIDLFAWCLMPNHYHYFQRARVPNGVSKFHQKWGTGYTNYFNLKYKRSGALFQGRYKRVIVTSDAQAAHLVCYIHANRLDLWRPNWKEQGLSAADVREAIKFLNDKKNRWSSHQDYWGIKNFPSLISREFLDGFFKGEEGYRRYFINWLKQYQRNVHLLKGFTID